MASKGEVLVSCMLKNTGDVKGAEVVLLYFIGIMTPEEKARQKIDLMTTPWQS